MSNTKIGCFLIILLLLIVAAVQYAAEEFGAMGAMISIVVIAFVLWCLWRAGGETVSETEMPSTSYEDYCRRHNIGNSDNDEEEEVDDDFYKSGAYVPFDELLSEDIACDDNLLEAFMEDYLTPMLETEEVDAEDLKEYCIREDGDFFSGRSCKYYVNGCTFVVKWDSIPKVTEYIAGCPSDD